METATTTQFPAAAEQKVKENLQKRFVLPNEGEHRLLSVTATERNMEIYFSGEKGVNKKMFGSQETFDAFWSSIREVQEEPPVRPNPKRAEPPTDSRPSPNQAHASLQQKKEETAPSLPAKQEAKAPTLPESTSEVNDERHFPTVIMNGPNIMTSFSNEQLGKLGESVMKQLDLIMEGKASTDRVKLVLDTAKTVTGVMKAEADLRKATNIVSKMSKK